MSAPDIIQRLGELPSLPSVYHRAREILDDPQGSIEALAQVVGTDSALTARILRVANSAFYGLPHRVDTVQRALAIIGLSETQAIILATSVISVFRDLPLGAVSMRSFWEHSIACGIAARAIARRRGLDGPERFYLAGLLHDIGRLPLYVLEPLTMSSALQAHRERQGLLYDIERHLLGTTHAEVGAALLIRWKIPTLYSDAAAHHHEPEMQHPVSMEASVTHVADIIANSLRIGTSGTRWLPRLEDDAWRNTGLDVADLPAIIEVTVDTARDLTSAFLEP